MLNVLFIVIISLLFASVIYSQKAQREQRQRDVKSDEKYENLQTKYAEKTAKYNDLEKVFKNSLRIKVFAPKLMEDIKAAEDALSFLNSLKKEKCTLIEVDEYILNNEIELLRERMCYIKDLNESNNPDLFAKCKEYIDNNKPPRNVHFNINSDHVIVTKNINPPDWGHPYNQPEWVNRKYTLKEFALEFHI